jgi:hypothetical protein
VRPIEIFGSQLIGRSRIMWQRGQKHSFHRGTAYRNARGGLTVEEYRWKTIRKWGKR